MDAALGSPNLSSFADAVQPDGSITPHLQKLAALGTMSAVLAHEFNNLLTPVLGYAQLALRGRDPEQMAAALERTVRHARRAAELCAKILDMSSAESSGPAAPVALHALVSDALDCVARDLSRDGIELEIDVDAALQVCVHAAAVQQVLYNLIVNARQALLEQGGRLAITAREPADGFVRLDVCDSGPGLPEAIRDRLFEPFVSTKRRGGPTERRGLGLGLAVSRQLVEESGGRIEAGDAPGGGARFTLWLPTPGGGSSSMS
ncbi:MAG: HAMP domain-containing sensor histidine kinase [Phycisphaerae bacterium]